MSKPAWMGGAKPSWVDPNRGKRMPLAMVEKLFGKLNLEATPLDEILGPDGILATNGLSYRQQQLDLARAVAKAINERRNLIGQASTGAGKFVGYAVPAILHALKHGKRVAIATSSKLLQMQGATGDLPMLQDLLGPYLKEKFGRNFTHGLQFGRDNYLCMKKQDQPYLPGLTYGAEEIIQNWSLSTRTGLLEETGLNLKSKEYHPLKLAYTADAEYCPGKKNCTFGESCYYYGSLAQLEKVDIMVLSHALLASHYRCGESLLPDFDVVIIDEAHKWHENLISAGTRTISYERFARLITKAEPLLGNEITLKVKPAMDVFFRALHHEVVLAEQRGCIVRHNLESIDRPAADLLIWTEKYQSALEELEHPFAPVLADQFEEFACDVLAIADKHAGVLMPHETKRGKCIQVVPTDVSSWSRRMMQGKPWIFTSATLATSSSPRDKFSHCKRVLGITHCSEEDVGGPYDYARSQFYYIPRFEMPRKPRGNYSPEQEARDWAEVAAEHYREVLMTTQGRALLLFCSYLRMQILEETLIRKYGELPWPCRSQGGSDSETELISWFQSTPGSVLFSVTLWEGINVPGYGLVGVIMDHFPLPPVNDPVINNMPGGYSANAYPMAHMKCCQGAGRGLRSERDRALISIMDPRMLTDHKMAVYVRQLPGRPGHPESPSRLLRREDLPKLKKWLEGPK